MNLRDEALLMLDRRGAILEVAREVSRLIEIKLRSGLADPLRAQDIADVIGLVRHRGLTLEFAAQLDKGLRAPFRKIVRQIARATG